MEIYLMQHGLALSAEENAERPLSEAGIQGIKATGAAIKRQGISFDLILHSPEKRTRQTAALIAEIINFPYSDLTETTLLLPQKWLISCPAPRRPRRCCWSDISPCCRYWPPAC